MQHQPRIRLAQCISWFVLGLVKLLSQSEKDLRIHAAADSTQDCKGQLECWHTTFAISPPGVDLASLSESDIRICFNPGVRSAFLGLGIKEYYTHLRDTILKWLRGGAKLLKLDGIGNPAGLDQTLEEDFDAAVTLIAELRKISSHVFINLSTGTWPSPFWLLYSDTVWRRGHDHFFEGSGPARERWITYRDAMVYANVVVQSPLFPLSSLMVHGIIFAKDAWDLNRLEGSGSGISNEPFKHEVRSAFGSGVMLQELYITPSLLNSENWDDIAEAARWASGRTETLADVQWFGGDPAKGEVYGWAAWYGDMQNSSAILTLRNPSSQRQSVYVDPVKVFSLPDFATGSLVLNTPFTDQRPRQVHLVRGRVAVVDLPAFAVLVFDTNGPAPSPWDVYFDTLIDNSPIIFWTILALIIAGFTLRGSAAAPAAPAAVPLEELRRRRLAALERRTSDH